MSSASASNLGFIAALPAARAPKANKAQAAADYGKMPLAFEENVGQTDSRVDFIARTGRGTMFVTPTTLVMALPGQRPEVGSQRSEVGGQGSFFETQHSALGTQHSSPGAAIHMEIVGANPNALPTGVNRQAGIVNYFIGNDPSQWRSNIPTFGGVQYDDVYPGIDLVYYGGQSRDGNGAGLEYDFIVSSGADPNPIALNFAGADGVEINRQGDLVVHTAVGDVVQQKPFAYQETGGTRHEVASQFVADGTQVRFEIGTYDASRPLVIDPIVLGYSTFLGGSSSDFGYAIAVDSAGSAYVTGRTGSADFPTTPGVLDTSYNGGGGDVFVTKLRADRAGLLYSTYLGGTSNWEDDGFAIAVDSTGNAYVTGRTGSHDFPITPGAFQQDFGGNAFDAFVAKLRADGSDLIYSTFLGGNGNDFAKGIAVDGSGSAYVTGQTISTNFPTTPGAFDTVHGFGDAFVTKLRADGSGQLYSTYLGWSQGEDDGLDIAVDSSGNAYVTGFTYGAFPTTSGAFDTSFNGGLLDGFVAKLNPAGSDLVYSTLLGGPDDDNGNGITVDASDIAYVTGATRSSAFPTTPGSFDTTKNGDADAFVSKLSADGSSLVYSTFIGGSNAEGGGSIALDDSGNAFVTGSTQSSNFPTTPDAIKRRNRNGMVDAYVAKLNTSGTALVYSSYFGGGNGWDFAFDLGVDSGGNAYIAGYTESNKFPVTPGAFDKSLDGNTDAFVIKFAEV